MKKTRKYLLPLLLLFCFNLWTKAQISYPQSRTVRQVDTIWGHILNDPYRWLENDSSQEVKNWIQSQQAITDAQFAGIGGVDSLFRQLAQYNQNGTWGRLPAFQTPQKIFFYNWNRNRINIKLYYRLQTDTMEHLLFDTWTIHPGIRYNLSALKFSPDGKYFLAAFDQNGEEYPMVKVFDTENNQWLPDSIPHCYEVTLDWTADSKGFIYGYGLAEDRDDPASFDKDVFKLHLLKNAYSQDQLLLNYHIAEKIEKNRKGCYQNLYIKNSKKWIYCQPNQGLEFNYSNIYVRPNSTITDTLQAWKLLYASKDSVMDFLETPEYYYFISAKGNGFRSLLRTPSGRPDFARPEVIIPEENGWRIESMAESKSCLLVAYSKYGFLQKTIAVDKISGRIIPLKALSAYDRYEVVPFGRNTDQCMLSLYPVNRPRRSFVLDILQDTLLKDPFWAPQNQTVLDGYEDIISEVVEVQSYDGTMVPLSILRNKNTPLDGSAVCLITGYGAYGINDNSYNSYAPFYSLLLQRGVILANAYVRGGGAKGEAWRLAGMKNSKANTWKDFIACAAYLIDRRYTKASRLGCTGASAGGILIGRAITERPDLFAAAHIQAGVVNLTRSSAYLNGINNYEEFGNPENKQEFEGLMEMDALLHIKQGVKYPALLIGTGVNDHRVAPWMPYKFTASMQANSVSGKPVLLQTDLEGGHFGDANAKSLQDSYKRLYQAEIFLLWQCGHKDFQKKP